MEKYTPPQMLEYYKQFSTQPLPMPDGSTRMFTMTNWHWETLAQAQDILHFSPRRTVRSVIGMDWDETLDNKMMLYLGILWDESLEKIVNAHFYEEQGSDQDP